MDFDFPRAGGLLLALVGAGIVGLAASGVMTLRTVLMIVLPSMVVFGVIAFWIGVKHGKYRSRP